MKIPFFFGNKELAYFPNNFDHMHSHLFLLQEPYTTIMQTIGAQQLFFLRQIHSIKGYIITSAKKLPDLFSVEAIF